MTTPQEPTEKHFRIRQSEAALAKLVFDKEILMLTAQRLEYQRDPSAELELQECSARIVILRALSTRLFNLFDFKI